MKYRADATSRLLILLLSAVAVCQTHKHTVPQMEGKVSFT